MLTGGQPTPGGATSAGFDVDICVAPPRYTDIDVKSASDANKLGGWGRRGGAHTILRATGLLQVNGGMQCAHCVRRKQGRGPVTGAVAEGLLHRHAALAPHVPCCLVQLEDVGGILQSNTTCTPRQEAPHERHVEPSPNTWKYATTLNQNTNPVCCPPILQTNAAAGAGLRHVGR
jgi:hypothetical protein